MKKNVKIGLAVGAVVVVLACVLLIPFSTINVDLIKTFGTDSSPTPTAQKLGTWISQCPPMDPVTCQKCQDALQSGNPCDPAVLGKACLPDMSKCTFSDSATDTFDLVYGSKTVSAKLNIRKLFAALGKLSDNSTTFPVKTNLLHTMFEV